MPNLTKLSNEQLADKFQRLLRTINRAFEGGSQYGIDLPTLNAVRPDLYEKYLAIRQEGRARKVAGKA